MPMKGRSEIFPKAADPQSTAESYPHDGPADGGYDKERLIGRYVCGRGAMAI